MIFHPSRIIASIFLAGSLLTSPLHAHDTWAERVILILFGEPGADHLDTYQPEDIREVSAIDAAGAAVAVAAVPIGKESVVVRPTGGEPVAVFFTRRIGHYIITGSGENEDWKDASAADAAKAERSWTGSYTVTSILAWHPSLANQRDRHVELVPLVDPQSVKAGATLPLLALRAGKPVAGMAIGGHDESAPKLVSDEKGHVAVPVKPGHQVILGTLEDVKGGHTVGHLAVLSFTHR